MLGASGIEVEMVGFSENFENYYLTILYEKNGEN